MFGYVNVNQEELKLKDFKRYRGFYCGLCRELKTHYGRTGQITLSYDLTFTAILLTSLFEEPLKEEDRPCLAHAFKKQHMLINRYTDYLADMSILMAWYKADDNYRDDHDLKSAAFGKALKKKAMRAAEKWPVQNAAMKEHIEALTQDERAEIYDLDRTAGHTGAIMAEILNCEENDWSPELRTLGFFLGKFVYLMDAYEDIEKDLKKGSYNPWKPYWGQADFEERAESILTMMMAECSRAFERLPVIEDVEILRNILYCGVWTKFTAIHKKREERADRT